MAKVLIGVAALFLILVGSLVFALGQESQPVTELNLRATGESASSQVQGAHAYEEDIPCTTCHESPLRVAVAAVLSPKETLDSYQELIDYLGEKLGRPAHLIQRKTYAETNDLVRSGNVDLAFVSSGAYIEGHEQFGLELLVMPEVKGEPLHYSYIIVPKDSPVESFEQLRGRVFAFSDPLSNSGHLSPSYRLAQRGETPDSFFQRYIYTYGHDNSIKAVAQKMVDGAAVASLVYDYAQSKDSPYTAATKIIERSPPYPAPPVVISPHLDPLLHRDLKNLLLKMHTEERGRAILGKLLIDKFVVIDDSAYDILRRMREMTRSVVTQ